MEISIQTPDVSDGLKTIPTETTRGGFTGETEVLTVRGAVPVQEITAGDTVYALEPTTRLVKRKSVSSVESISYRGPLIGIETRRADLRVTPSHPVLFHTRHLNHPQFVRADSLTDREWYRFINTWRIPECEPLDEVDITDFTDEFEACVETPEHGHTFRAALPDGCLPIGQNQWVGYRFDATTFKRYQSELEALGDNVRVRAKKGHHRRPYRFDGDDFIRFIGWFVTEGSTYRGSDRESTSISIAQEKRQTRAEIEALLNRLRITYNSTDRAFRFGSYLYGNLLESICGASSKERNLPSFIWNCSTEQKRLLFKTLVKGDGNEMMTYYTSSPRLASDLFQLGVELGFKPRYSRRGDQWILFFNWVNDRFQSSIHVNQYLASGPIYRFAVEDYSAILAGRNGKFQWTGVNRVA